MAGGWHSINIPLKENLQAIIDCVNELSGAMETNCPGCCWDVIEGRPEPTHTCKQTPKRFKAEDITVVSGACLAFNSIDECLAALEALLNL